MRNLTAPPLIQTPFKESCLRIGYLLVSNQYAKSTSRQPFLSKGLYKIYLHHIDGNTSVSCQQTQVSRKCNKKLPYVTTCSTSHEPEPEWRTQPFCGKPWDDSHPASWQPA